MRDWYPMFTSSGRCSSRTDGCDDDRTGGFGFAANGLFCGSVTAGRSERYEKHNPKY